MNCYAKSRHKVVEKCVEIRSKSPKNVQKSFEKVRKMCYSICKDDWKAVISSEEKSIA